MANQYFTCTLNASVSGSNVSAYMNYSRSGTYTYQDTSFPAPTMTIDGTAYSDTGFQSRVKSGISIGNVNTTTYTKSCGNGNRGVTFTAGSGLRSDFAGTWSKTVTVNVSSPPTGLAISLTGRTWNSATCSVSVSSWGSPVGANRWLEASIRKPNSTGYANLDKMRKSAQGVNSPQTIVLNNSAEYDRGYGTIRGCQTFMLGAYAWNGSAEARIAPTTTYYLPPSPLQTLGVDSQTWVSNTQTKMKLVIIGGTSTNNENVSVATEYRYQVNGGSWTGWTSAGVAATPWTAKFPEITVAAGATVVLQARQSYQSQYSEVKEATVVSWQKPQNVKATIGTITKDSVSGTFSLTSWGKRDYNQELSIGLAKTNTDTYRNVQHFYVGFQNPAVNTNIAYTINNSSLKSSTTDWNIESNTRYYIGVYAKNTDFITETGDSDATSGRSNWQAVVTSPETTEVSLTDMDTDTATGTVTAHMHAFQLGAGGGASVLTPKYRYSVNGGTTWSNWVSLVTDEQEQDFDIVGLPFNTLITIESKTTGVRDSTVSTMTFRTSPEPGLIESFDWEFDDLRRQTITWKLNIKPGFTVAKNAILTIKSHNINMMSSSTALSATVTESLPNIYKPNETLAWSLTVSTSGTSQTIAGNITMPRPILGLIIDGDGTKKYITDMVKAGGAETADDFKFDVRYDKFKVR